MSKIAIDCGQSCTDVQQGHAARRSRHLCGQDGTTVPHVRDSTGDGRNPRSGDGDHLRGRTARESLFHAGREAGNDFARSEVPITGDE